MKCASTRSMFLQSPPETYGVPDWLSNVGSMIASLELVTSGCEPQQHMLGATEFTKESS